jgi:hypothetical protein
MRTGCNAFPLIFCLAIAGIVDGAGAQAQTITGSASIALKSGESVDVGEVFYVINCKSLLRSTPEVEILDGPPGVTATVKEKMVLPRGGHCANRVPGGLLVPHCKGNRGRELHPNYTSSHLQDQRWRAEIQSSL